MRVLMFGTDLKVFSEGSAVRERTLGYGSFVEELVLVVYTKKSYKTEAHQPKTSFIPTNTALKTLYFFDAYRIAKKIIGNWKLEIGNSRNDIIISCQDPFETGLVGYALSRLYGVPFQVQVHTDFLSPYFAAESWKNRIRVFIGKWIVRRADCVRVVSRRIEESLRSAGCFRGAAPVEILPIISSVKIAKSRGGDSLLKDRYKGSRPIFLVVSRLAPEKNVALSIRAFAAAAKPRPEALLLIVGGGPERKNLEKLASDLKVETRVRFEQWTDNVVPYYNIADVLLFTSNYDGYGLAIVEALEKGLPVIATDVGVAKEVIKDGVNGFVVPVGDRLALGQKIDFVLNKEELLRLKDGCRKMPPETLSEEGYMSRYRSHWETCLSKNFR